MQISFNRTCRTLKPQYIVIHDTGNMSKGADAKAHFNYFNTGNRKSSADVFCDDKTSLVVNDYHTYYTWHCGDGGGKYGISNENSVGVEICINSDGDYNKAVENAIITVKALMKELNIPADRVVRHYDASRKLCPASMSAYNWKAWHEFKRRLTDNTKEVEKSMYYKTLSEIPEDYRPTIEKLVNKGIIKGYSDSDLHLSEDMCRIIVYLDRAGNFK